MAKDMTVRMQQAKQELDRIMAKYQCQLIPQIIIHGSNVVGKVMLAPAAPAKPTEVDDAQTPS